MLMALRAFARLCLRFTGRFDFAPLKLTAVAAPCFRFEIFCAKADFSVFLSRWGVRSLFCAISRGDERLFIARVSVFARFGEYVLRAACSRAFLY